MLIMGPADAHGQGRFMWGSHTRMPRCAGTCASGPLIPHTDAHGTAGIAWLCPVPGVAAGNGAQPCLRPEVLQVL